MSCPLAHPHRHVRPQLQIPITPRPTLPPSTPRTVTPQTPCPRHRYIRMRTSHTRPSPRLRPATKSATNVAGGAVEKRPGHGIASRGARDAAAAQTSAAGTRGGAGEARWNPSLSPSRNATQRHDPAALQHPPPLRSGASNFLADVPAPVHGVFRKHSRTAAAAALPISSATTHPRHHPQLRHAPQSPRRQNQT
jgi:hypothetical protein